MTYIIGHQKPDLDTVVSSVATQYLFDQKEGFGHVGAQPVLAGTHNEETSFVFEKFGVKIPPVLVNEQLLPGDSFVLVDHNEKSQRFDTIANDAIIEIIDHHPIELSTNAIFVTVKPWGSTASIIYFLMKQNNVTPPQEIAGLMLSAILSDTVGFRSSTTTQNDKDFVTELAHIAEINDVEAYIFELFKVKSNVTHLSPQQIVTKDYKKFKMSGKQVLINQVETVEQSKLVAQKAELTSAMRDVKQLEGVEYIFCAISDVLAVNTKMLYSNENERRILEEAFDVAPIEDAVFDIGPRLSRKNEFVPPIQMAIKQLDLE